jgi:hypothetical protein
MRIQHKLAVLVVLLIVSVFAACYIDIGRGSVKVRYVGAEKEGYYEVILNYNGATDYQMGQLYGKKLVEQYPTIETSSTNYIADLPAAEYDAMMTRVQQVKGQVPQEYRDFLDGLASKFNGGTTNNKDDGLLSVDEVFYFSLISEIHRSTQCSMIAVYGSSSDTGKPIIGRLVDWSGMPNSAVFYIHKGNKKIMSISPSLLTLSVTTGLSKKGLFVAVLDSPTGAPFPDLSADAYYSYHFDLRYALENYNSINDIANYLSQRKYTYNHLVVIGDAGTVKVLENDLGGTRSLRDSASVLRTGITWEFTDAIAAVNGFLLPGNFDNFSISPFNTFRWQSIRDQLAFYKSSNNTVTAEEMKAIATYYGTDINQLADGAIMNSITQQIVIYDSIKSSLKVFFRNNRTIGTANTADTFNVDNPEFWDIPVQF